MTLKLDRRQFVRLAGYGGIVAASSLSGFSRWAQAAGKGEDFHFVQLSEEFSVPRFRAVAR